MSLKILLEELVDDSDNIASVFAPEHAEQRLVTFNDLQQVIRAQHHLESARRTIFNALSSGPVERQAPLDVPGPDGIHRLQDGGYVVRSKTQTGVYWRVYGRECTCPAGRTNTPCWHLGAVASYCKAEDAKRSRPAATTNKDWFV